MIGGAPSTASYTQEIGVDCFADDAISAVDLAFRLADTSA
jgi:methanogenic corrinoid protein MtbC1